MIRYLFLFSFFGVLIFWTIEKTNRLNALRLEIPTLNSEVKRLQRENERITFEIACFLNPDHLLSFLEKKEFSHLVFPTEKEVIEIVQE